MNSQRHRRRRARKRPRTLRAFLALVAVVILLSALTPDKPSEEPEPYTAETLKAAVQFDPAPVAEEPPEATPEPVSRYADLEITEDDVYTLACLVYHEARGEPFEGQVAVVEVVFNRMLSDRFPDTVEEVVFQRCGDVWQFSTAPYLWTAEPGETQYAAVETALSEIEYNVTEETVYFSMKQSTSSRRQPLVIMITTSGTVRESVFDNIYGLACDIADGKIEEDSFLPVLYELDERAEWTDPQAWVKANPGLGTIKQYSTLANFVERAKKNPEDLPGVLCKDFNVPEVAATLTGYEIVKLVKASRACSEMALSAFESYVVEIVAENIARRLEKYIFTGTGNNEPGGVKIAGQGASGKYTNGKDQITVKLLTALVTNLPQIILTIVRAIPQIITSIVSTLVDHIPDIIETGIELLTSLITDLPSIIAELVRAMPEIISGMVGALGEGVSDFAEIGGNLVRGLWDGIQSLAGWLWDKVSDWISSIWDGICDFFGIASPSKKMAWISEMNVEGAAKGIDEHKGKAVKAYGNMTAEMLAEVEEGMTKVNASLADSIGEIETGFDAKATIEQVSRAVPSLEERRGVTASGGGDTRVENNFHIDELVVREEADVKKIARELYTMQRSKSRGRGVVS